MFVIFRWWYFVGAGGVALAAYGGIETNFALKSGPEPTAVTMEQLTNGAPPPQPWVKLGAHVALLDRQVAFERSGRVKFVLHPIVGPEHPYLQAWKAVLARYGRVEDVPVGQLPRLDDVRVLVETRSLSSVDPRSNGASAVDAVEGMLHNGSSLNTDERRLVENMLPGHDHARLLVLEAGRRPVPAAFAIGLLVAGFVAICWAVKIYRRPAVAAAP